MPDWGDSEWAGDGIRSIAKRSEELAKLVKKRVAPC